MTPERIIRHFSGQPYRLREVVQSQGSAEFMRSEYEHKGYSVKVEKLSIKRFAVFVNKNGRVKSDD